MHSVSCEIIPITCIDGREEKSSLNLPLVHKIRIEAFSALKLGALNISDVISISLSNRW